MYLHLDNPVGEQFNLILMAGNRLNLANTNLADHKINRTIYY